MLLMKIQFWDLCLAPPVQTPNHSSFVPTVGVQALDVTVSQSSVQVARGKAAILPCSFTTSAALNNLNIIWMVIPLSNANQPEQVGRCCCVRLDPAVTVTFSNNFLRRCGWKKKKMLSQKKEYNVFVYLTNVMHHPCVCFMWMAILFINLSVKAGTQEFWSFRSCTKVWSDAVQRDFSFIQKSGERSKSLINKK